MRRVEAIYYQSLPWKWCAGNLHFVSLHCKGHCQSRLTCFDLGLWDHVYVCWPPPREDLIKATLNVFQHAYERSGCVHSYPHKKRKRQRTTETPHILHLNPGWQGWSSTVVVLCCVNYKGYIDIQSSLSKTHWIEITPYHGLIVLVPRI